MIFFSAMNMNNNLRMHELSLGTMISKHRKNLIVLLLSFDHNLQYVHAHFFYLKWC